MAICRECGGTGADINSVHSEDFCPACRGTGYAIKYLTPEQWIEKHGFLADDAGIWVWDEIIFEWDYTIYKYRNEWHTDTIIVADPTNNPCCPPEEWILRRKE